MPDARSSVQAAERRLAWPLCIYTSFCSRVRIYTSAVFVPCFALAHPFRVGTFVANRIVWCEAGHGARHIILYSS